MTGTRYVSFRLVLSRKFSPDSKFGLFHRDTGIIDYDNAAKNDLSMQNLLFFAPVDEFRITGGFFYDTRPGFSPTVGMQYINRSRDWFIRVSPRINIDEEPSYSIFSVVRYSTDPSDRFGLYAALRTLNVFDGDGHIKGYQWTQVGLAKGATQFGLAVNFDEFGRNPALEISVGLFIRREIF